MKPSLPLTLLAAGLALFGCGSPHQLSYTVDGKTYSLSGVDQFWCRVESNRNFALIVTVPTKNSPCEQLFIQAAQKPAAGQTLEVSNSGQAQGTCFPGSFATAHSGTLTMSSISADRASGKFDITWAFTPPLHVSDGTFQCEVSAL